MVALPAFAVERSRRHVAERDRNAAASSPGTTARRGDGQPGQDGASRPHNPGSGSRDPWAIRRLRASLSPFREHKVGYKSRGATIEAPRATLAPRAKTITRVKSGKPFSPVRSRRSLSLDGLPPCRRSADGLTAVDPASTVGPRPDQRPRGAIRCASARSRAGRAGRNRLVWRSQASAPVQTRPEVEFSAFRAWELTDDVLTVVDMTNA